MKKFLEMLKGARHIEWFLAVLSIAILLLTYRGGEWSDSSAKTEQERRLTSVLSRIEGVGRVEVMVCENAGVLIVADGADDIATYLRLQRAVHALIGTEIQSIEIVPHQD